MFGKPVVEYLRFERVILAAILIVGIVRLALTLAGAPAATARPFSMTVACLAGIVYCGVAVPTRGFGGYRHLLPLLFFQAVVVNAITIVGIAIAGLTGSENVFTVPEYSKLPNYVPHALGHVVGMVVWPLATWPIAALLMWLTRTVRGGGPARARA